MVLGKLLIGHGKITMYCMTSHIQHTAPYKILNIDARCRGTIVTLSQVKKKVRQRIYKR